MLIIPLTWMANITVIVLLVTQQVARVHEYWTNQTYTIWHILCITGMIGSALVGQWLLTRSSPPWHGIKVLL